VIKSGELNGHVARIRKTRIEQKVLVKKPERERPLGGKRVRYDIIKIEF
jgi:hypothetical protein